MGYPMKDFLDCANRMTERNRRNLEILDVIRKKQEISRTDIASLTGINIVSISNYVNSYVKKRLVYETGLDTSTGGRRPELLKLNNEYAYSIGVDLGSPHIVEGTSIIACLLDMSAKVIAKERISKTEDSPEKLTEKVIKLISSLITKSGVPKDKIKGIGMGIWGPLDRHKGTARYAVENGGTISYVAMKDKTIEKFNIPTFVEHDSMLAALGEKWVGIGFDEGVSNILFMCSDSSVGLIIRGELYCGSTKSAGELNINPPVSDTISHKNCWEGYDHGCCLRSRGIDLGISLCAKRYFEENNDKQSKILDIVKGDLDKITIGTIIKASKDKDEVAMGLLKRAGSYLGAKIAYLINLFNPQAVVIGRGIEQADNILFDSIREAVKLWGYEEAVKVTKIIPTSLGEDVVAIGAGVLIIQDMFAEFN